jgi:molybdopterin-guanine dinucleotide biosynthesis protein A
MSQYNLLSYKEARIEALLNKNKELELEIEKLTSYIFDLCDVNCPEEYKQVVQSDVFKG